MSRNEEDEMNLRFCVRLEYTFESVELLRVRIAHTTDIHKKWY